MTESQQLNGILFEILKVLERIEEKLEKQDQHFEHRKIVTTTRTDEKNAPALVGQEFQRFPANETGKLHVKNESRQNNREPGSRSDISNEIRLPEIIDAIPRQDVEVSKICYSKWNLNIQNRDLNEVVKDILEKYTGDYWKIPNDNRLPLKLFKTSIEDMEHHGESQSMLYNGIQAQKLQRKMELLKQFNADLTRHKGNDFLVVDFDSTNKTRLYGPGKKAVGAELMVNPDDSIGQAPWSRLM